MAARRKHTRGAARAASAHRPVRGADLEALRERLMMGRATFAERLQIADEGTYMLYVKGRRPLPAQVQAIARAMELDAAA